LDVSLVKSLKNEKWRNPASEDLEYRTPGYSRKDVGLPVSGNNQAGLGHRDADVSRMVAKSILHRQNLSKLADSEIDSLNPRLRLYL
jgi:hypothetical protein